MIWKITTVAFACLAVSGWGFARHAWGSYLYVWDKWVGCLDNWKRCRKNWMKALDRAADLDEENEGLCKTVTRLRWRIRYPITNHCQDELIPMGRLNSGDRTEQLDRMKARWRVDRTTGSWGRYLKREREIQAERRTK